MHMMRYSAGATTLARFPLTLNSQMRSRPGSLRGSRPQMGPERPVSAAVFDLGAELQFPINITMTFDNLPFPRPAQSQEARFRLQVRFPAPRCHRQV
eukprot:superscaffoldBa00007411_g22505